MNALSIWTKVEYRKVGSSVLVGSVLAITDLFVELVAEGAFPNSVVFNGSCESTKLNSLSQAFLNKGAGAYLGFDGIVTTSHSKETSDQFFSQLVVPPGKTAREAYDSVDPKADPHDVNVRLELMGMGV